MVQMVSIPLGVRWPEAVGGRLAIEVGVDCVLRLRPDKNQTLAVMMSGLVRAEFAEIASEAIDLALRIAQVDIHRSQQTDFGGPATGKELKAYHGGDRWWHEGQRHLDVPFGHRSYSSCFPGLRLPQPQARDSLQVMVDRGGSNSSSANQRNILRTRST